MAATILLVDDERDLVDLLQYNLVREGYNVETAYDGHEALERAQNVQPDLVILDIMMPQMDGLEVCRRLRGDPKLSAVPILMLTARTQEIDEVKGLEIGADDYLPKPVSPRLLLSRVQALLRRVRAVEEEKGDLVLHVQDLTIDRERYLVVREEGTSAEERFRLPRKEFELLYLLASVPGKVFSREAVLDEIWGTDVYVMNRTVDVHVRKIREKLGHDYIETVKGVGYRFIE